jgi:hypothetical protein
MYCTYFVDYNSDIQDKYIILFHDYYFRDAMCFVACTRLLIIDNIIHSPFRFFIEALLSLM